MNYKEETTDYLNEKLSILVYEAKDNLDQQNKLALRIYEINQETKAIADILISRKDK